MNADEIGKLHEIAFLWPPRLRIPDALASGDKDHLEAVKAVAIVSKHIAHDRSRPGGYTVEGMPWRYTLESPDAVMAAVQYGYFAHGDADCLARFFAFQRFCPRLLGIANRVRIWADTEYQLKKLPAEQQAIILDGREVWRQADDAGDLSLIPDSVILEVRRETLATVYADDEAESERRLAARLIAMRCNPALVGLPPA